MMIAVEHETPQGVRSNIIQCLMVSRDVILCEVTVIFPDIKCFLITSMRESRGGAIDKVERVASVTEALTAPMFGATAIYLASRPHKDGVEQGLLVANVIGLAVSIFVSAFRVSQTSTCMERCSRFVASEYQSEDEGEEEEDEEEECPVMCAQQLLLRRTTEKREVRTDWLVDPSGHYYEYNGTSVPVCPRREIYQKHVEHMPPYR